MLALIRAPYDLFVHAGQITQPASILSWQHQSDTYILATVYSHCCASQDGKTAPQPSPKHAQTDRCKRTQRKALFVVYHKQSLSLCPFATVT
jgi:hypothetical protein